MKKVLIYFSVAILFAVCVAVDNDVDMEDYLSVHHPRTRRAFFDNPNLNPNINQNLGPNINRNLDPNLNPNLNQNLDPNLDPNNPDLLNRNRTFLCDELKLKAVVDEHANCYRRAENSVVNKIANDNMRDLANSLCQVITEKVDCINLHASKCLTPDRVDLMRMNFLATEISKANRNNDLLGQTFINQCPVLYNHQAEYVQTTFGANHCNYEQVFNLTESREECKVEALDKKRKREMIALDFLTNLDKDAKRSILFQLYCDFQWDWLACYENTTFSCTSEQKKEEILAAEKRDFQYIEENFREMGIHFSFQECSNYTSNANILSY